MKFLSSVPILMGLLLTLGYTKCQNTMEKDFCQALMDNDRKALQPLVNAFLETLNPKDTYELNINKIKKWLEAYDCIEEVRISAELLDTDPPVQQFNVSYAGKETGISTTTIGVILNQQSWTFSIK